MDEEAGHKSSVQLKEASGVLKFFSHQDDLGAHLLPPENANVFNTERSILHLQMIKGTKTF